MTARASGSPTTAPAPCPRSTRQRAPKSTTITGAGPVDVAYDGTNIWVTNISDNTVSKIVP